MKLQDHPLRDIVARKYHSSRPNPGTSMHSWDGEVVACLWLQPLASESGGNLIILQNEALAEWSEEEAFDWGRPFLNLNTSVLVDVDVLPQPRRLAIWKGQRLVRILPTTGDWPPTRYENSWIEVYFLFGSQRRWVSKIG